MPEKQELIETFAGNVELLKEYRISYGKMCKYNPVDFKDLWICACGKENRNTEERCHYCGAEHQSLINIDIAELSARKDARLAKERKIKEQEAAIVRESAKKANKIAIIAILFAIITVVTLSLISVYTANVSEYKKAVNLINPELLNNSPTEIFENLDSAIEIFENLNGFKDSEEQLIEAKYFKANLYLDSESYSNASEVFAELGDYKDSAEKLAQLNLRAEVIEILKSSSGVYGSRSDESSCYYGFKKAAKLIKNFKGEKTDEMKKLYDDINTAMKYYGKWKISSGKLDTIDISNTVYKNSIKKIAFTLEYDEYNGVRIRSLPVQKGSEEKDGSFSYYTYETEYFTVSSNKKYTFECKGIKYSNSVSYIPEIKDNSFKIKYFEDGKYTANIVLSR